MQRIMMIFIGWAIVSVHAGFFNQEEIDGLKHDNIPKGLWGATIVEHDVAQQQLPIAGTHYKDGFIMQFSGSRVTLYVPYSHASYDFDRRIASAIKYLNKQKLRDVSFHVVRSDAMTESRVVNRLTSKVYEVSETIGAKLESSSVVITPEVKVVQFYEQFEFWDDISADAAFVFEYTTI